MTHSVSIVALIVFLFPLAYSPGPGNLFFAAIGARSGFAAGLSALAGYHLATLAVTLAMGFGFLAAVTAVPMLFGVLRIVGAGYVLWIAVRMLRAREADLLTGPPTASALDGAALLLLNPKAYMIIGVMFGQFLGPGGAHPADVVLIATVFTLNNLVAFCAWALAGNALARLFRTPVAARLLNIALAALLAGVALWILVAV